MMDNVYVIIPMFVAVVLFMVIVSAVVFTNFVQYHQAIAHVYRIGAHGSASNITAANMTLDNISAIHTHIHTHRSP